MELFALDSNFGLLASLPYLNLQWTRRYYELGEFSVQLRAADYRPEMRYVYSRDRPETGVIQKVAFSSELKGDFVQLSGFFLECVLGDRIVFPTFYGSGNLEVAARSLVATYAADIPRLQLGPISGLGSSTVWQETGDTVADTLYPALQSQELSFRCRYDLVDDAVYFTVWQGADRTQSQTANSFVVFSRAFRSLAGVSVLRDCSNCKNYAVVAGAGEGAARIVDIVDLSAGGYQQQVFVDARDLSYDETKQSLDEYKASLRHRGLQKLTEQYADIFNADAQVDQQGFRYLQDYDLGDKCDIVIDEASIAMEARIIAIYEVFKQGQHTVEIELGDKVLTNYEKARL